MIFEPSKFFMLNALFVILLIVISAYCVVIGQNLIRILIGLELFTKAVTLLLIVSGVITNNMALAQAFVITLIVVEVVIIMVAAGIVIGSYQHNKSLDVRTLRNLKG